MNRTVAEGTWVEIGRVLLEPAERAPQVPEDTRKVPLEMRLNGRLVGSARLGEGAEIETLAGRRVQGTLTRVNPDYSHGFGPPIAELLPIGGELREILAEAGAFDEP